MENKDILIYEKKLKGFLNLPKFHRKYESSTTLLFAE